MFGYNSVFEFDCAFFVNSEEYWIWMFDACQRRKNTCRKQHLSSNYI